METCVIVQRAPPYIESAFGALLDEAYCRTLVRHGHHVWSNISQLVSLAQAQQRCKQVKE